ncbi:hypothetical protein D3C72_1907730 [compost metagenome]
MVEFIDFIQISPVHVACRRVSPSSCLHERLRIFPAVMREFGNEVHAVLQEFPQLIQILNDRQVGRYPDNGNILDG